MGPCARLLFSSVVVLSMAETIPTAGLSSLPPSPQILRGQSHAIAQDLSHYHMIVILRLASTSPDTSSTSPSGSDAVTCHFKKKRAAYLRMAQLCQTWESVIRTGPKAIRESVCRMIGADMLPFNVVEGNDLKAEYAVLSRATVT